MPFCYEQTEPLIRLVAGKSLLLAHATGYIHTPSGSVCPFRNIFSYPIKRNCKNFTAHFLIIFTYLPSCIIYRIIVVVDKLGNLYKFIFFGQ